jgi:hypothetical protein
MTAENDDVELPQHLLDLLPKLPVNMDRKDGAALVSQHCFPVSPKTIKDWPLPWTCPNGKALAPTEAYLKFAVRKAARAHPTTNRWLRLKRTAATGKSEETAAAA